MVRESVPLASTCGITKKRTDRAIGCIGPQHFSLRSVVTLWIHERRTGEEAAPPRPSPPSPSAKIELYNLFHRRHYRIIGWASRSECVAGHLWRDLAKARLMV